MELESIMLIKALNSRRRQGVKWKFERKRGRGGGIRFGRKERGKGLCLPCVCLGETAYVVELLCWTITMIILRDRMEMREVVNMVPCFPVFLRECGTEMKKLLLSVTLNDSSFISKSISSAGKRVVGKDWKINDRLKKKLEIRESQVNVKNVVRSRLPCRQKKHFFSLFFNKLINYKNFLILTQSTK